MWGYEEVASDEVKCFTKNTFLHLEEAMPRRPRAYSDNTSTRNEEAPEFGVNAAELGERLEDLARERAFSRSSLQRCDEGSEVPTASTPRSPVPCTPPCERYCDTLAASPATTCFGVSPGRVLDLYAGNYVPWGQIQDPVAPDRFAPLPRAADSPPSSAETPSAVWWTPIPSSPKQAKPDRTEAKKKRKEEKAKREEVERERARRPRRKAAEPPSPRAGEVTLMLRNIPNKYTAELLLEELTSRDFMGHIDFLYLPIDFRNTCNLGYAFINFTDEGKAEAFQASFDGVTLPGFRSNKVCKVSPARVQGYESNVERLRTSPVIRALDEPFKPLLFKAGEPIPFPARDEA